MIIGEKLKIARKNKGWTQQELGNKLWISKVSICGYEKGTRIPTIDNFIQLLDTLEVSADFLLGREVSAVCESDEEYRVALAKEDLDILKELKNNPELYNQLIANPKRSIELIKRRMKR